MTPLEFLLVAVSLSLDAVAVAVAGAATGRIDNPRAIFRLAFHFGLFQGLMPAAGWLLASTLALAVHAVGHWVASILLFLVGGRMVQEALTGEEHTDPRDPSKGMTLVALSVATSIDAFAVGVGLEFLGTRLVWSCLVIGLMTAGMTLAGILFGQKLQKTFGRKTAIAAGIILIGISVRICLPYIM